MQSEDGLEFVKFAFSRLEQVKGDEAKLQLSMLYDEFMGMTDYTHASLKENPLQPMQQWPEESYGPVSKEKERMRLYVESRVAEHFPGMNWREFNKLTPEQTEWVLELVATQSSKRDEAERKALQGLTGAANAMKNASL